jgi:hypothetical protein
MNDMRDTRSARCSSSGQLDIRCPWPPFAGRAAQIALPSCASCRSERNALKPDVPRSPDSCDLAASIGNFVISVNRADGSLWRERCATEIPACPRLPFSAALHLRGFLTSATC